MAFRDPNAPIIARKFATGVPPNQRIEIDSNPANEIRFYTGLPSEVAHGRVYVASDAGTPAAFLNLAAPNLNALSTPPQLGLSTQGDGFTEATLDAGQIRLVTTGNGGGAATFSFTDERISNAAENWQIPTLSGSWANLGGIWTTTRYRLAPDGFIDVIINVTWPAGGPPSNIFTLAAGYRPAAAISLSGEGNGAHARVTVLTSGVVQFNVGSTTAVLITGRFPKSTVD